MKSPVDGSVLRQSTANRRVTSFGYLWPAELPWFRSI
jgi:hypothetical protein